MNSTPEVIVCPVFESTSSSAINHAAEYARRFAAKLLILHVVDKSIRSLQSPGTPFYRERRLLEHETRFLRLLDGVNCEQHELVGEPTVGIRDFVIRNEVDVAVLGASSFRGGDSIDARTRRIADSLPCSFMIIKEASFMTPTRQVPSFSRN